MWLISPSSIKIPNLFIWVSFLAIRCSPPIIVNILSSCVILWACLKVLSIPACEQPVIITSPEGDLYTIAESSISELVLFLISPKK